MSKNNKIKSNKSSLVKKGMMNFMVLFIIIIIIIIMS